MSKNPSPKGRIPAHRANPKVIWLGSPQRAAEAAALMREMRSQSVPERTNLLMRHGRLRMGRPAKPATPAKAAPTQSRRERERRLAQVEQWDRIQQNEERLRWIERGNTEFREEKNKAKARRLQACRDPEVRRAMLAALNQR